MGSSQDKCLLAIQIIGLVTQIASLIFLVIYVIKTWEMASATRMSARAMEKSVLEMQEARDEETAPYIIVYFDLPIGSHVIYLVVKNIGHSVARGIKLTFDPPLQSSDSSRLERLSFIHDGIASMPPDYELKTLFDTSSSYFSNKELPLKYQVKALYYGGLHSEERRLEQTIDLSAHRGVMYTQMKNMNDLVDKIEKLTDNMRHIQDDVSDISNILNDGIILNNPGLMIFSPNQDVSNWEDTLFSKVREFEYVWSFAFKETREKGFYLHNLQAHISSLANQLVTILSWHPDEISTDLINSLSTLIGRIFELSRMTFYMDGGVSLKSFNDTGDTILKEFHVIKDQVKKEKMSEQTIQKPVES